MSISFQSRQPLRGPALSEDFHRNVLEQEHQTEETVSLPLWWEIKFHKAKHLKGFLSATS